MNLHTFIPPSSSSGRPTDIQTEAQILKVAVAAGDKEGAASIAAGILAQALPKGPLRVTITHEPFVPWFKLEYEGQTEELDHEQCLEWFRLRGAKDLDRVNDAINQAYNFGRGTKGAVYSADGSVAIYEDRPGVVVVIGAPKPPPVPVGQEEKYLPKI